ncbi:WhiB family transcriptional regulator [Rhodococcus gannanensis]|uniref:WhiB family transcriptional regulator n=1 Tax=Rhodococcus gannanensis TaxID=1960308 RepID=A0ABW4P2F3_9NOCA
MGTAIPRPDDDASWWVDPGRPCARTPESWWFPPARTSRIVTARIAALCVGCPVRAQCADDARTCDDRYGIRAGVDLQHVADPDRRVVLHRIAHSPAPNCEPVAVGRPGFRRAPVQLIAPAESDTVSAPLVHLPQTGRALPGG